MLLCAISGIVLKSKEDREQQEEVLVKKRLASVAFQADAQ